MTTQRGQTSYMVGPTSRRAGRVIIAVLTAWCGLTALASPAAASPTEDEFYTVPALGQSVPHGTVLRTRELTSSSLITRVARAVQVVYTSRGADPGLEPTVDGDESGVTGTILVPHTPWTGSGPRPVIGLAAGTHGQGQNCSPSKQIARNEEIQLGDTLPLLARGYVVAVSDYAGYTNGGTHPYTIGHVLGRNVLDAVRAARAVPDTGVTAESPVGLWGYSEGGAAASWAAQLAATYSPELRLAAVASGGTPTSLADNGRFLDGSLYVDFTLNAATGLDAAYPDLDLSERYLNDAGRAAQRLNGRPDQCLVQTVLAHPFARSSTFTTSGKPLDELLAVPDVARVVDSQTLGRIPFAAPTFLYWGDQDDIVPASTQRKQFDAYCGLGMHVQRQSVPGLNHVLTQESMIPTVTDWLHTTITTGTSRNDC